MKNRPIYGRIPVDYAPMQDLSIDIKTMPQAFGGYHLLLVITCDQTNFTIAIPLRDRTAQTIAEALIYRVIYLFGPPRQIISDEATKFTSAIIQAILKEIFQDNQMVYLLAPHASALQTNTTKFKQDFIGPLFIDTALDKTHYRLKDATGLLLDGTYHVNCIKKGSACTPLGIADKFDTYETALKNTLLNKFAIETPNNKLQEVTLQDGSKELNYLPGTIMDYAALHS